MVHELCISFEDAMGYAGRHPTSDVQSLQDWHRLATWLREQSRRLAPEPEDSLPPCYLKKSHIIQKI